MPTDLQTRPFKDFKLVFVHLGKAPVEHLWLNMKSVLGRFPSLEVVFISDREHPQLPVDPRVKFFKYLRSDSTQEIFQNLAHDSKFRSGFWQFTLERFLALNDYHELNQNLRILHIESDILLLPGLPFEEISNTNNLAWQRVDENRDIASLFFSPTYSETAWFAKELLNLISENAEITDMTALNRIRSHHPNRIKIFPSYSVRLGSNLVCEGTKGEALIHDLSQNSEEFKGIFDPAAYGMWLTGSDPRNYYGKQIAFDTKELIKGGTYLDPSKFEYSFSDNGELFCRFGESQVRIWSLHIHSKDFQLLGESWLPRLHRLVRISGSGHVFVEFHFSTFLRLIRSNFGDKTMLSWVLHIPKLRLLFRFLLGIRRTIRDVLNYDNEAA